MRVYLGLGHFESVSNKIIVGESESVDCSKTKSSNAELFKKNL